MKHIFWTIRIFIGLLVVGLPVATLAFTAGDFIVSPTAVNIGTARVLPGSAAGPYAFSIAVVGGPIADPDPAAKETATFFASSDASWLSLTPTNGSTPGSIAATASISETMGSGVWVANVTIMSGLDTATTPVTVTVTMTVIRSIGDLLTVSPTTLDLKMTDQNASQQTFPITIANADPNQNDYQWSAQSDVSWLVLSASTGAGNSTISLKVDPQFLFLNSDTNGDGIPDGAVGTITYRSTLNTEAVTLTVNLAMIATTELSVSPGRLFWTVEKTTADAAVTLPSQKLQIFGYESGWTASSDVGFISTVAYSAVGTKLGGQVSTDPYGYLEVTPEGSVLAGMGYGNHTGYITIADLDRQFLRQIPVTINVRKPGEAVYLPVPEVNMSVSQVKSYYSMMEATDASLINVQLPVPMEFAYYPTAATCQAAGGTWIDPDNVAGNLNEYCSLNQHAYVLMERPQMDPGKVYALTKSHGFILAYENGIKVAGADGMSYADGPISHIPFGPLQLIGNYGTVVVSMRVGANLTSAVEVQRLLISLQTLEGQWKVTEAYNGGYYVYDYAPLYIERSTGPSGYSSSWGGTPVTVSTGDGTTWLYRLSFEQKGISYSYEIQSLSGNQLSGRWVFAWPGGSGSWEVFQAQRQLLFP
jgi:Viral BACON domain